MKTSIIILNITLLLLLLSINTQAKSKKDDKVEKIERFKYLYRYQNFYIGGQPFIEELRWLKSKGLNKIINLRSEKENDEYSDYAYNEKSIVKELGFEYYEIPVGGIEDYSPEKLEAISIQMSDNDKIFLHCRTAGRATQFFMAYLIKDKGYTINEAVHIGRGIKFSFPLEQLLDVEIKMEKK